MYIPNPPPKKKVVMLFKLKLNSVPDKKVFQCHGTINLLTCDMFPHRCFWSISHLSQSFVAPVPTGLKQVAAIKLRLTTCTASQLF